MAWLAAQFHRPGSVVTVPLFISVAALVWIFRFVDGVAEPLSMYVLGREVPGLGVLIDGGVHPGGRARWPPT